MKTKSSYKLIGMLPLFLLAIILVSVIPSVSSGSEVINTFLNYEDAPTATSKTVTQGDSVNLILIAYGHGEQLGYEKLELVSSTLIFQEGVLGTQVADYTWLYSKVYTLNTGILTPGTYTLRFTARTKVTQSVEYSELQLIILPKVTPPVCGNGKLESGENCDNGALNGYPCTPAYGSSCGYCSSSCNTIVLTGPSCGDGIKQSNEQCDLGALNGQVCSPLYGSSCSYCSGSCKITTLTGPYCGDGIKQSNEQCDDGNFVNGDGCSNTCKIEGCGDGIRQSNEQCDDGNTINNDGCSSTCKIEKCGDGVKQTFEQCDLGSSNGQVCTPSYGSSCTYCSNSCTIVTVNGGSCGNGKLESGEQCDNGVLNGQVCSPLYGSSCTYCSGTCKSITLTGPYCGDGVKQSNEQCDDGNKVNGDGCSSTCQTEIQKECILQLTKSVNDTNVQVGDMVVFTLKYKNIGNGDCTGGGVKIQDVFNSRLKLIAYSANVKGDSDGQDISFGYYEIPAFSSSTNTLTLNAHVVSPGEEGTVMVSAKILEPSICGNFQITNYFKVWSNEKGWQNSNTINIFVNNECYTPVCGNAIKDSGEECDYGTSNGNVCSASYGGSCTYCSNSCKFITVKGPYCGDGVKQSNEQCDDGNKVNGDGCSSTCQTEIPKECILQLTKSADKTNVGVGDTVTFTLKYKNIGNGECTGGGVKVQDVLNPNLDFVSYTKSLTGDSDSQGLTLGYYEIPGYVESTNTLTLNAHVVSPGEEGTIKITVKVLEPTQCGDFQISNYFKLWSNEKGWQNSNTIKLYVNDDCPPIHVCGDGVKDTGEECDYGNSNGQACSPLYGSSCTYCSGTCKIITLTGPYCGDGIKQSNEQCDLGALNGQVCSPLYGSSCNYCSASCQLKTVYGGYCGNGIKEDGEQCDDGNKINGDGCSSTCQTETPKECIIQITKSVDRTNTSTGEIITFTLKYKNIGTGNCTGGGVKVQDILNSNLDFMSYTKSLTGDSDKQGISYGYSEIPGFNEATNTLTWNAHVVSPGEEGTVKITAKILEPEECGDFQISNYFKVWSNEKGWQTSNTVNVLVNNECYNPGCGNGVKDAGEQCDDGNTNNNDGCSATCKIEYCGDCIKQTGEQCDDGNTVNGDGCSSTCKIEYCGDGTCNNHETCSTCSQDCGECEEECHTCKDSKPLDDSGDDSYYYYELSKKPTVISGDATSDITDLESTESTLKKSFSYIMIALVLGILTLFLLAFVVRLSRR